MSKKGLGRGFASLIPTDIVEEKFDVTSDSQAGRLVDLPLVEIEPNPEQPRHVFDEEAMQALANSMRERGLLQPIVVTRLGGAKPRYQIVAGERRWRAAKMLNWTTIPAIVRTFDEQKRLELAIIENLQRSDLNMFEIATAYAKLKAEFNLNVDEVCKVLGIAPAQAIRMLINKRNRYNETLQHLFTFLLLYTGWCCPRWQGTSTERNRYGRIHSRKHLWRNSHPW